MNQSRTKSKSASKSDRNSSSSIDQSHHTEQNEESKDTIRNSSSNFACSGKISNPKSKKKEKITSCKPKANSKKKIVNSKSTISNRAQKNKISIKNNKKSIESSLTITQVSNIDKNESIDSSDSKSSNEDKNCKEFKNSCARIDTKLKNQSPLDESKLEESEELITTDIKNNDQKIRKRDMKVQQKSNLQILFKNEEILREGGLTCVQKYVLAQIDKEQNTWLYNSVEREIKKINLRALKKRKQLSKKEYQLNKLFFNEWIRWWKPKKRLKTRKLIHQNVTEWESMELQKYCFNECFMK